MSGEEPVLAGLNFKTQWEAEMPCLETAYDWLENVRNFLFVEKIGGRHTHTLKL